MQSDVNEPVLSWSCLANCEIVIVSARFPGAFVFLPCPGLLADLGLLLI
jgi:hypothetical protein